MVRITFLRSRSVNFNFVVNIAQKFDRYIYNGITHTVDLTITELFDKWDYFSQLHCYVTRWAGCRVYFRDKLIAPYNNRLFYALQDIYLCSRQASAHDCKLSEQFPGWGCRKLDRVKRHIEYFSYQYWYNFGHFINNNTWVINKAELLLKLKADVERHYLDVCPYFDEKRIIKAVESLPDKLFVDEKNWTKVYKDDFVGDKIGEIPYQVRHLDNINDVLKEFADDPDMKLLKKDIGSMSEDEINRLIDLKLNNSDKSEDIF